MRNGLIFLSLLSLSFVTTAPAACCAAYQAIATAGGSPASETRAPALVPGLVASPPALEFGNSGVKDKSAPQFVTVTNTAKAELIIKEIVRSAPEFDLVDNCSGRLPAGSSCEIGARFAPAVAGIRRGSITLVIDAGAALSIPLSGNAVVSPITLSETYLRFRTLLVDASGLPQGVSLTNHSDTAPVTISNITVPPDFRLAPTQQQCSSGGVLAPLATCNLSIRFVPARPGALDEQIIITASDSASPHAVALRGLATGIKASVPSLRWNPVIVGTLGESQSFELSNLGNTPVQISDIQVRGDFVQENSCGKELVQQQSCSVTVRFGPKAAGKRPGEILIRDSDPGRIQNVFLIGTGTEIGISPVQMNFGTQNVGTASQPETVTVTNRGAAVLNINSLTVSGDFVIPSKTCGAVLPAGQDCRLTISFSPTAGGARTGLMNIETDSHTNIPLRLSLSGTGK